MENNHEQQETNSKIFQDQNNSFQVPDATIFQSQPVVYPKQESFFRRMVKDKQKLLLLLCSLGLLVGITNSIALMHVLSRQDRPAKYLYHNGMMWQDGQSEKFNFEDRDGSERGNFKRNLPGMNGKSFQFEGGTFKLPGGGTIEIKPGTGNSSSSIKPNTGITN
ncbi:MAG: hypothetical protein K0R71_2050 [Bacillales bacterium]|jgi:hypothetical protein|nr:hypothetical protein [Bacillales bacterium]